MPLTLDNGRVTSWSVRHIAVVGPGIVGMPMAAMLAHAGIVEGTSAPATVTVIQRDSPTSGWKVAAINQGRSPIGGVEPELDHLVREAVGWGRLRASHEYAALADADLILIAVQTDKKGFEPDYGPLYEALDGICEALRGRPQGNVPVIVFESTLAPSSMTSVIRDRFASHGLVEGRNVLLGNSPNRVMPGRLVERVRTSDKVVAGLHPDTPRLIKRVYSWIVTEGTLHETNSMTAEIVKTLENAYRDVRIAYAAEVCRYCDEHDINFFALRDLVNERLEQEDAASQDSQAVPTGGLLVPMLGVGGHCLPKDGILLWWRALEAGLDTSKSLILEARRINDESPAYALALAERKLGSFEGKRVALLGTAYRGNSEDTRNSPTLALAELLRARGIPFTIHDPHVHERDANLKARGLSGVFTRDLAAAVRSADVLVLCTPHAAYSDQWQSIVGLASRAGAVADLCNLRTPLLARATAPTCVGLGSARQAPSADLVQRVVNEFRAVEAGVGREVGAILDFLNARWAPTGFNAVEFGEVVRLAATCPTGCRITKVAAAGMVDASLGSRLPGRVPACTRLSRAQPG